MAGEWEAEKVQAMAGAGHNVMLNADWFTEIFFGHKRCSRIGGSIGDKGMEGELNDLFLRFQIKGFMPIEIPGLVKDVFHIMENQDLCSITTIDQELEELGWGINIMDNTTFGMITSLVEGNVS